MISSVQVSPDGCYIGAVSEQGNLLVFDVATLAKELRKVRNTSLSYPAFVQPGSQGNPLPFGVWERG